MKALTIKTPADVLSFPRPRRHQAVTSKTVHPDLAMSAKEPTQGHMAYTFWLHELVSAEKDKERAPDQPLHHL
ncbi:hypothetical protein M1D88_09485 [Arthrobacter sp. R1-13]